VTPVAHRCHRGVCVAGDLLCYSFYVPYSSLLIVLYEQYTVQMIDRLNGVHQPLTPVAFVLKAVRLYACVCLMELVGEQRTCSRYTLGNRRELMCAHTVV
jgi:hypothetical protein